MIWNKVWDGAIGKLLIQIKLGTFNYKIGIVCPYHTDVNNEQDDFNSEIFPSPLVLWTRITPGLWKEKGSIASGWIFYFFIFPKLIEKFYYAIFKDS